jgi:hypothetical protein
VLLAAASSSAYENHVLVCAVARSRTPVLRVLHWPHDATARVVRFAFSDDAQHLLVRPSPPPARAAPWPPASAALCPQPSCSRTSLLRVLHPERGVTWWQVGTLGGGVHVVAARDLMAAEVQAEAERANKGEWKSLIDT